MIRLNLLDEKVDRSGIHLLHGLVLGLGLLLTAGACFLNYQGLGSQYDSLQNERGLLETKLSKLKKVTKEVEGLEKKKKLLADKLLTIANLKANKSGPVQLLDDLNLAVPERAWLDEVRESSGSIELSGVALDNQTVSDFMDNLEASKFFRDVDLGFSTQVVKDNVKLQSFSLKAKRVSQLEIQKQSKAEAKKKES